MKYLLAFWLAGFATLVYANCTTNTYFYNGRMVTCTTCCYGSSCNTNCF